MHPVGPPEVTITWPPLLAAVRHHPDIASRTAIFPICAQRRRDRLGFPFRLFFAPTCTQPLLQRLALMLHMELFVNVFIWFTRTILPLPAVTSRPPGAKFSVAGCPVASRIGVTRRNSSDTNCRIWLDSEKLTWRIFPVRISGAGHKRGAHDLNAVAV